MEIKGNKNLQSLQLIWLLHFIDMRGYCFVNMDKEKDLLKKCAN